MTKTVKEIWDYILVRRQLKKDLDLYKEKYKASQSLVKKQAIRNTQLNRDIVKAANVVKEERRISKKEKSLLKKNISKLKEKITLYEIKINIGNSK